ncbi:G/U mismatch-specific DNA glycosylase [Bacteriovorax sp. PP10]|uniref:G/U mismatch-specific DNA glycosylase n=1 Tax=Bacteriovorax antarcticus TaxID=3088717 RepID=A0ABU5VT74_9BACT|nr:G/U mismatch-specific DNA glycosylase [Bacteriovorax sp. PP10]MEA9356256.1 G/U mismatch-specific DNA glycosylase [Bacteriovorax sp. PP10]
MMKLFTLPDLIQPKLKIVFCGLNPGLGSAKKGHHFMNKSNRFWKVLHLAGFTDQILEAKNDIDLLNYGYGITSAVSRATKKASDLSKGEFQKEAKILEKKILKNRPVFIAFLGKAAYVEISGKREIDWGLQDEEFGGAKVWVLPNPSGLNRNFSLEALVKSYSQLRKKSLK